MVVLQPFLNLTTAEPFRCKDDAKKRVLASLSQTLEVARAAHHGAPKTHFTVFPEYSICGLDGIALIESALNAETWSNGTIIIGGTDALSKTDFTNLCAQVGSHVDMVHSNPISIPDGSWVNCEITWVKSASGVVERWLQPKITPAWPEQNVTCDQMFCGKSVFTFTGRFENNSHYRFFSLVCFDWIGSVANKKIWQWVLEELERQANQAGGEFPLSWLFVIQNNDKPSHQSFLGEVGHFFNQNLLPNVRRDRTCLVFANAAGKTVPGKASQYGQTSLVFPPQALFPNASGTNMCNPTFCNGGAFYRSSPLLSNFHDVLFRERGSCIHSFIQINPGSLNIGAAGRMIPLHNAAVFPLDGISDVRAPSGPVPASIKWINDQLDDVPSLSKVEAYKDAPLAEAANTTHGQTVTVLRQISGQKALEAIKLASQQSEAKNADAWSSTETDALEHLVHTLDIATLGSSAPIISREKSHAKITLNGNNLDIVAIRGNSHLACHEHSEKHFGSPRQKTLLVSRDPDNNPWNKKLGSILRPRNANLGDGPKITDPASNLLQIGYRNLLDIFRNNNNPAAIPGAINDWFTS
jgi:hypothetical protein